MRRRLGTFFLVVGFAVLALFFTSDAVSTMSGESNQFLPMLCWGVLSALIGFALMRGTGPEFEESKRFRTVRKIASLGKKKDDGED